MATAEKGAGQSNARQATPGTTELVVFRLDDREYALPVEHVGEVLRMVAIAPVPRTPDWTPGVINLRGHVVRVVDLRTRLELEPRPYDLTTPIIVTESRGRVLGLVADAVVELLTLPESAVDPPSDLGERGGFVSAVARAGDRIILVLGLERLGAEADELAAPA